MWEPTRHSSGEGRRRWAPEEVRHPPRERHGPAVPPGYWRQHARRGDPKQHGKPQAVRGSGPQPDAREGQAGLLGVADGFVVPAKPGNAGGGKGPEFREGVRRGTRARRVAMSLSPPMTVQAPQATSRARPRIQRGGACVLVREPGAGRSSRQDRNPTGASPAVTIAQIGHVAMPHPGRGNPPGDAWCKRPGRPMPSGIAVGATGGSSEWGRLNISE